MLDRTKVPTRIEALLSHQRLLILAGPMAAAILCWAWLVPASIDMYGPMDGLSAWMMDARWDWSYGLLIFTMWVVMMVGMMLPALAPTLLLFAAVCRSDAAGGSPVLRVYAFAAGYLGVWVGFSVLATLLQWQLARGQMMTPMMTLDSSRLGAAALVFAGLYQWTSLKQNCLARCQSPAAFISSSWRPRAKGALQMGAAYGLFCLGCCWALMLLLFVGGVMSLWCIGLITLLVLVEKLAPWGRAGLRLSGGLLIGAGAFLFAQSLA